MGRRRKSRIVTAEPPVTVFKPQGVPMTGLCGVVLGLDGFEALRLVDADGLSQEQAAAAMGVSRPTLCRVLGEARAQVARALSRGWAIRIETEADSAVPGARVEQATMCRGRGQGPGCVGKHREET